ncbi:KAT8 regulatory NSL complex subunit 3 isoform X3 [Aethina tumida]|uniref:KAT8 regulatory NSL complex subunit 3 isoform X3 n=1 Tax=Aethina tumida TaxID=116153 RepID=UPI002148BB78|nr:KAT8 regulatory NSL complex subunit 3 isoform X3 [Aethina tumida]
MNPDTQIKSEPVTNSPPMAHTPLYERKSNSDFDFATPVYMPTATKVNQYARENWQITNDHSYARPWNWRPETTFLRPTKTLFMPKAQKMVNPLVNVDAVDEDVDVDSLNEDPPPTYDLDKAKNLMEECERVANVIKPEANDDVPWEDKITRANWTINQMRVFQGFHNALNMYHMAKLAYKNAHHEPILRRTVVDKAVQRVRRTMTLVSWDPKLCQWIHNLLLENLTGTYLASYLDILQTLQHKIPLFVDRLLGNSLKSGVLSHEGFGGFLKKKWDPVAASLQQDKPKKLPGNPIIVIVPSGPHISKRIHKWVSLLSNLAMVVTIPTSLGENNGSSGHKTTITHLVDTMFATTRGKIQEITADYPGRSIVLVGFNAGAALALQVAQMESAILCVVCLGFSLLTADGPRGDPEDGLLELQRPVLFVIGQSSNTSSQEEVEDLRERMRVETGLVVVGSADDFLRVTKKKCRSEGITQSVVDRCVVDEVGEFISGIILSPYPPQLRQSPIQTATSNDGSVNLKKSRKRYHSNASSLDSEPPSPTSRLSRPVGRPPGSKTKARSETKWPVASVSSSSLSTVVGNGTGPIQPQTSTNTPSTLSPASSSPPSTPTMSATEGDSGECGGGTPSPQPLPVKRIKTLKPVDRSKQQLQIQQLQQPPPAPPPLSIQPGQIYKTAKHQVYGMNRNVMVGGQLSTLLQGGIKSIQSTKTKPATGIKVLENVTLNSSTTAKLISNSGRTIDLSKITVINSRSEIASTSSGLKTTPMSNVILMPDGTLKTVHSASAVKGVATASMTLTSTSTIVSKTATLTTTTTNSKGKAGKFITSKRQLIGNKPTRPMKKITYNIQQPGHHLAPPTNLTTQDIMNLPIVFADDHVLNATSVASIAGAVSNAVVNSTNSTPETNVVHGQPTTVAGKIIGPANKFVLVNKQISGGGNFIISPNSIKKVTAGSGLQKQPKFTKIILSKRSTTAGVAAPAPSATVTPSTSGHDESKPTIIKKMMTLPSEITVKKTPTMMGSSSQHMDEGFDLENELVATAVPKPNFATSDVKNITVLQSSSSVHNLVMEEQAKTTKEDENDPDYLPPKKRMSF